MSGCLACGTNDIKPGRRYCSKQCRQKLIWSLSLSKGLLQTLNTRYAVFSFTERFVALDVMPAWSNRISRFIYKRKPGYSPAHTLKELTLEAGKEWYKKRSRRLSRSFASQSILEENIEYSLDPDSIKPSAHRIPKLSADQKKGLMQQWIEDPKFQLNNKLPGCWSYNGYTNRWSPPLWQ
jgi:hypothetical protein